MRKTKRFVKTFKEEFVPAIRVGAKLQTIRPEPKRDCDRPRVGDTIDCRRWKGNPYRSKQEKIREFTIKEVADVIVAEEWMSVDGKMISEFEMKERVKADGFSDYDEMREWFRLEHDLPFSGILIAWNRYPVDEEERRELKREKLEADARYG